MTAEVSRPRGWRFTDGTRVFSLYPEQRKFLDGDTEVELGQRPFDLLVCLVENAGRLTRKSELLSRVWQCRTAAVSTVSTQVSIVRSAIGDDCIATINSKGYQFTLPVEPISALLSLSMAEPPLITLPHPSGHGVGREAELTQLAEHCRQRRLVTVVGAGGVGKTWLAIQLGWRVAEDFPDGVHLIDFGPVKEPMAVAGTVAQALGVALRGRDDPARVLATVIGKQRMLLIFDSCEYVVGPVRELVKGLLAQAPNLSVLATSQEILRLPKEMIFRLEPLPQADAVSLFLDCVRASDYLFRHDGGCTDAVAEICRRLDGMPLALEMAAALVPSLGIEGVRDGLDRQRFAMLDSWPRVTDDARQATLTAVLDWSCGLLDEADRSVFRRLACFRGSFSGEAAVAAVGGGEAGQWNVMASLGRLVDKSLLVSERGPRRRYRMLETMALHAATMLEESGEADMVAERHARYYISLLERAELAWETMSDDGWSALYGMEIDNARAALDWALGESGRAKVAITLAGTTARLWERSFLMAEGRKYLDRAVALIGDDTPPENAACLLRQAGALWRSADRQRAIELMTRSANFYRSVDDMVNCGSVLGGLGGSYIYVGQYEAAAVALSEARGFLEHAGRTKSLSNIFNDMGSLALVTGDLDEARRCYGTAISLARLLSDSLREGISLINLGEVEFRAGSVDRAIAYAQHAANNLRLNNLRVFLLPTLLNLASYWLIDGDCDAALQAATEALPLAREDGGHGLRLCLQVFALLAARSSRYAEAALLVSFVNASYTTSGEIREHTEQRVYAEISSILDVNFKSDDARLWNDDAANWSEHRVCEFVVQRLLPLIK